MQVRQPSVLLASLPPATPAMAALATAAVCCGQCAAAAAAALSTIPVGLMHYWSGGAILVAARPAHRGALPERHGQQ